MTIHTALRQGARLLEEAAVGAPRLTAEVLLCHALGKERSWLFSHPEQELTETSWIHYGRYLYERLQGKPTQYITRRQEFYGRHFLVTPAVLIPRPETEHVVETVLRVAPSFGRCLDIGAGSGAIGITLQLESRGEVIATDVSRPALAVAAENSRELGADVRFVVGDLAEAFTPCAFDLVVSNPPYVPDGERSVLQREIRDYEPALALFGGPTGIEIYERLIRSAARVLRPGGRLVVEIGYKAEAAVLALLGSQWNDISVTPDLAGWPRVVSARLRP